MLFCDDFNKKMNNNMQPEAHSSKALSKEETKGLLILIEESRIINNKKTNAAYNKLKVQEWVRIADAFNATMGICRRTPQQLRLKWENLKKNSRKRSAVMRMECIKTGGGPLGYFPPDEILDRVAALLGSTGEVLVDMFVGDTEFQIIGDGGVGGSNIINILENSGGGSPLFMPLIDSPLSGILTLPMDNEDKSNNSIGDGLVEGSLLDTNITPIASKNRRHFRSSGVKKRILKPDYGQQARNIALAEYYNIKRKFIETKFESSVLDNEKKKIENEKLKLENERLKLEIRKLEEE